MRTQAILRSVYLPSKPKTKYVHIHSLAAS